VKRAHSLYLLLLLFIASCSTKFDINANWQEITVVYGLLNQNETTHYIKINKAFLGEGNALYMAQVEDSSSYNNKLDVKVEEWENNTMTNFWYLDTTTIYNKEPGIFYNPNQVLYKFNASLNENRTYKLIITNQITGKQVTSETELVHQFSIIKPSVTKVNFTSSSAVDVLWYSTENGKRYQLNIRFNYKEVDPAFPTDTLTKYVDWLFAPIVTDNTISGKEIKSNYIGQSFYSNLYYKITTDPNYNPNAQRFPDNNAVSPRNYSIDFIVSVAADDFNTYMEVSEPSNGIVQEKPSYTNITGGIGIFSSRYNVTKHFAGLNTPSLDDSLINGHYTSSLHFHQ